MRPGVHANLLSCVGRVDHAPDHAPDRYGDQSDLPGRNVQRDTSRRTDRPTAG